MMNTLAKNFKKLMDELGYDYETMGKALGLHANSIRNTGNGTRKDFPLAELFALAKVAKKDVIELYAYLFDFQADNNYTPAPFNPPTATKIGEKLFAFMENRGLRIEYLATALKVSTSHARDILREGSLKSAEVYLVAKHFKINPLAFLAMLLGINYPSALEESIIEEPQAEYGGKNPIFDKLVEENHRLLKIIEEKEAKETFILNMLNDCYQKKSN